MVSPVSDYYYLNGSYGLKVKKCGLCKCAAYAPKLSIYTDEGIQKLCSDKCAEAYKQLYKQMIFGIESTAKLQNIAIKDKSKV